MGTAGVKDAEVLEKAVALGYDVLDTAFCYGN